MASNGLIATNRTANINRRFDSAGILHRQVREFILQDLLRAGVGPGEKYYTEAELALRHKVSRNTIRRAMNDLEEEGYLTRRRRVGTIVGDKMVAGGSVETNPTTQPAPDGTAARERMLFVLPQWDDTLDGFFASRILNHLVAPDLGPRWSVEVRHARDQLEENLSKNTTVVVIDPALELIPQLVRMAGQQMRVLVVDPKQQVPGAMNLCVDYRTAARDAVKRLYALGHKNVGIINYVQNHNNFRQSYAGYLDAHRELNRSIAPQAIVQMVEIEETVAPDVSTVSAWVCVYWGAVKYVMDQCRQRNLSIPRDVSVVCMDDPVDEGVRLLGKRISVVCPDTRAVATTIRVCLRDWDQISRDKMLAVATQWIDRETIAPPPEKRTEMRASGA